MKPMPPLAAAATVRTMAPIPVCGGWPYIGFSLSVAAVRDDGASASGVRLNGGHYFLRLTRVVPHPPIEGTWTPVGHRTVTWKRLRLETRSVERRGRDLNPRSA